MSRRREVPKRRIIPDPKFKDKLVSKFTNTLMLDGKKAVAEGILYGSFDVIGERFKEDPLEVFRKALDSVKPKLEVKSRPLTSAGAFVVGIAFAFGWTPCIGPILAGILALASTQETVAQGMVLLSAYSLGLGVPFLLTSVGIQAFSKFFARFRRYVRVVEILSGILLIAVGVLIFTDRLTLLAGYLDFFNRFSL